MSRLTDTLGRVRVAAPCDENWDEMRGDARVRFCARCSQNVYNLSAMTRREAERVVLSAEGRLCVRLYRRKDGTILTQNCPNGFIKLKRRVSRIASATAAAAVGLFTGVAVAPEANEVGRYERTVAVTLPNTAEAAGPAVNGVIAAGYRDSMAQQAEAFTIESGMAGGDTADLFVILFMPLSLIMALFTLLTWPLFLISGEHEEEERREALRIWNNEWSKPNEDRALPREGSAVGPEAASSTAPRSTLTLQV